MRAIRWILGWSVGLAVPAAVFVFVAGPEEAARVARDAWGGVGEVASEALGGTSSEGGEEAGAPGWDVAGAESVFHGMACESDGTIRVGSGGGGVGRIVDEGEFLSALRDSVGRYLAITGRPNVTRRDLEVGLASPPPSTLPLAREISTGARWIESARGQWVLKEGTVRFRVSFPCNYIDVTGLEGITEAVIPPPVSP